MGIVLALCAKQSLISLLLPQVGVMIFVEEENKDDRFPENC